MLFRSRHIERTRILVHILDLMPTDESDPVENYDKIRNELAQHSEVLTEKKEVIVLNKIDLDVDGLLANDVIERFKKRGCDVSLIHSISAVTGEGVNELNNTLWKIIKGTN